MIIDNYIHFKGKHSESATQRSVLLFHGMDIDEDIIFGLDGSYGFMYFENKNEGVDLISGKNEIFPLKATKLLGIEVNNIHSNKDRRNLANIKETIINNIPLISRVDIGYLPYWQTPEGVFFGGHFVVLCGYDEKSDCFYLSDNLFGDIKQVATETLIASQSSKKSYPINPDNQIFQFKVTPHNINLEKIGPVSLRPTVRNFLYPSIKNFGILGIKLLAKNIVNWPTVHKGTVEQIQYDNSVIKLSKLVFQMKYLGHCIKDFGTGGGLYRFMFSSYLEHLYRVTNNKAFIDSSNLLNQSAGIWQDIACQMLSNLEELNNREIEAVLSNTKARLENIIALEESAFVQLKKV